MMLTKFIHFCIFLLLGKSHATAQLDFGTYKIINQASQSSLCSHEVGQPIYVSTPGYSCDRELWQLGPGDEYGLYTIKNVGLNSGVQANMTSGFYVVTSNSTPSVAILPTEGHGHIIKFPNSNFVWTGCANNAFPWRILLEPESGHKTQLWGLVRNHDTISRRPSTQFNIQARDSKEEERNLEFLRGIEGLGGSAGYQDYLESLHTISNFTHTTLATAPTSKSFSNQINATGSLGSFFVYTVIQITAGGYTGQGSVWGVGFGGARFGGNLTYDSWEELISAKNDIQMSNSGFGVDAVFVQFFINGNQVAYLKAVGVGAGVLVGLSGTLTWTEDS